MFALDSNVLIHALKGKGRVRQRLADVAPVDLSVPTVIAYELEYGSLRSSDPERRQREIDRLLSVVTLLPFDKNAAGHAAQLRFELEKSGQQIGPIDLLIAGTALANGATLVTNNAQEFRRVPGLRVEDWL